MGRAASSVDLPTIAREWGRIGCTGFGGPPAHIALLRRLCVAERKWLAPEEFEDAIAAVNLLPGPASTQLAIYCAWRLRGAAGALVGGACFICPGLAAILVLAALFVAGHPPRWLRGLAAGADAAVPAVALQAAWMLLPASWRRAGAHAATEGKGPMRPATWAHGRWAVYLLAGAGGAVVSTPLLVLVLAGAGLAELLVRRAAEGSRPGPGTGAGPPEPGTGGLALLAARHGRAGLATVGTLAGGGVLASVAFVAFKVGALSYGGGFVIVPLMQHDAVASYHWMTGPQFLDAVALGQVTPGPVVQTVAVVGYAADRLAGGLLAALVAFAPSFVFVLLGGPHLSWVRSNAGARAFFAGAGPAAIGAIAGAAVPLARELPHLWQLGVLGAALAWLLGARRSGLSGIAGAATIGLVAVLVGAPASG